MKFTLGTAQLGLPKYGRTNATGCPPEAEAIALIRAAAEGGVRFIDCARAYGLAEERVGKAVFGDRCSVDGAPVPVATGFTPGSEDRSQGAMDSEQGTLSPSAIIHPPSTPEAFPISPKLTVITKLSPLAWLPGDAAPETVRAAVEASVYQSCYNLRVRRLPVLMLHRWAHHDSHGGQI